MVLLHIYHDCVSLLKNVQSYILEGKPSVEGCVSMHPGMAIDASQGADDAFRDGVYIPGWQLMHSVMAINASQDCDRCILGC